jgi:hypothetical protein
MLDCATSGICNWFVVVDAPGGEIEGEAARDAIESHLLLLIAMCSFRVSVHT